MKTPNGLVRIGMVVGVVSVVLTGSVLAQKPQKAQLAQFEGAAQQYSEAAQQFEEVRQAQQIQKVQLAQQFEEVRQVQQLQRAQLAQQRVVTVAPNLGGGSRIGLSIDDVADNDAADEGAIVRDVRRDSPAASAGFAEGDVIVEFDGERVRSARQLTRLVQDTPAGRTVKATVLRDGRRVELEVTPESSAGFGAILATPRERRNVDILSWTSDDAWGVQAPGIFRFRANGGPARLGVRVQEISSQLADYFGVDDGVLVSSVDEESVAAEAGLQAGDVITSVDGRAVEDTATLRRRLSAIAPGEDVSIGLTRAGRELELTVTIREEGQRRRLSFRNDGRTI